MTTSGTGGAPGTSCNRLSPSVSSCTPGPTFATKERAPASTSQAATAERPRRSRGPDDADEALEPPRRRVHDSLLRSGRMPGRPGVVDVGRHVATLPCSLRCPMSDAVVRRPERSWRERRASWRGDPTRTSWPRADPGCRRREGSVLAGGDRPGGEPSRHRGRAGRVPRPDGGEAPTRPAGCLHRDGAQCDGRAGGPTPCPHRPGGHRRSFHGWPDVLLGCGRGIGGRCPRPCQLPAAPTWKAGSPADGTLSRPAHAVPLRLGYTGCLRVPGRIRASDRSHSRNRHAGARRWGPCIAQSGQRGRRHRVSVVGGAGLKRNGKGSLSGLADGNVRTGLKCEPFG